MLWSSNKLHCVQCCTKVYVIPSVNNTDPRLSLRVGPKGFPEEEEAGCYYHFLNAFRQGTDHGGSHIPLLFGKASDIRLSPLLKVPFPFYQGGISGHAEFLLGNASQDNKGAQV